MSVVSVRLSDATEAFLHQHGIMPGTFARELVEREVKLLRLRESLKRLDASSRKPSKSLVELLREERDAH